MLIILLVAFQIFFCFVCVCICGVCVHMCVYGVHTCASVECLRVYMSVYGRAYLCICGGKRSYQVSWSYARPYSFETRSLPEPGWGGGPKPMIHLVSFPIVLGRQESGRLCLASFTSTGIKTQVRRPAQVSSLTH